MTTTVRSSFILTIAVVFLAGYSFMGAAWTAPGGTPPNNNTDAPINIGPTTQSKAGNLMANIMAAATSTWSPRYCDELGNNCWDPATGAPGVGTWGSWTNVTASRPTAVWHRNNSGKGMMVHYYISRSDVVAYVSPTGVNANQIQVTGVDGDSGERTHGLFMVPPGHYYRFNGGTMSMVAELVLPF